MPTEKELALAELQRLVELPAEPALSDPEIDAILDANLRVVSWTASTYLTAGKRIYPTVRNGRKYIVITPGTTGASEPTWSVVDGGHTTDNGVVFEEDGSEYSNAYNVNQAAWDACTKKMSKAAQFVATPGINMATIFDRWKEFRESFNIAMVG